MNKLRPLFLEEIEPKQCNRHQTRYELRLSELEGLHADHWVNHHDKDDNYAELNGQMYLRTPWYYTGTCIGSVL